MKQTLNLLLSEVQRFDPNEYSTCKVHYDGIIGKGRDWQYEGGGEPFEHEITPQQASLLSRLQNQLGGWVLTDEQVEVMKGLPTVQNNDNGLSNLHGSRTHVTGIAQAALYNLVK